MRVYDKDVLYVTQLNLPWERLKDKTVLISGASGMIGTFLIDVLMSINIGIKVIAIGRDLKKAERLFSTYLNSSYFKFISQDINKVFDIKEKADYVIHAASNTHPIAYATDPIGTIMTNITGTKHMLDYAQMSKCERFLFLSSVEVYGENRGDIDLFAEDYCGYIDCNSLRAGYPESKRAGEALCQAYRKKYGMEIVISRLSRIYGPTMLNSDTKAHSQFIKKGILGKDIVLKSEGNQLYSYSYVADAVSGILTILLKGIDGEVYNIADHGSDIKLKDLAAAIAEYVGSRVIFELPKPEEAVGYSKATKAVLDATKLQELGWRAHWNITEGIQQTIDYLKTDNFARGLKNE